MTTRETCARWLMIGLWLGALAGCQVAPGAPTTGAVPARASLSLTVNLPGRRGVLAFVEQVARMTLEVKAADGGSFEQPLQLAPGADAVSATFTGLAPGGARVTLSAYDGADRAIGRTAQEVTLEPGGNASVAMVLYLRDQVVAPSLSLLGPLPPLGATATEVPVLGDFVRVAADPTGAMWALDYSPGSGSLVKLALDGSELARVDSIFGWYDPYNGPGSFDVDSGGRLWVSQPSSLYRYEPDGTPSLQVANVSGWVSVDHHDEVLVSGGSALTRLSADGEVLRTYPLIGTLPVVAPGTDNVWVFEFEQRALLHQLAPDGQMISRTPIATDLRFVNGWVGIHTAWYGRRTDWDDLAVDASGNAWVLAPDDAKVVKVGPDGTLLGEYPACAEPSAVTVDGDGNVWVGSSGSGEHNLVKLAPTGAPLGTLTVAPRIVQLETDAEGSIWVVHQSGSGEGALTKVTP